MSTLFFLYYYCLFLQQQQQQQHGKKNAFRFVNKVDQRFHSKQTHTRIYLTHSFVLAYTHTRIQSRRERSALCCPPAGWQRPKTKVNKQRASPERKRVGERVSEWHVSKYVRIAFSVTLAKEIHIELRDTHTHSLTHTCIHMYVYPIKSSFCIYFTKLRKIELASRNQKSKNSNNKNTAHKARKYANTQCALSLPLWLSPAHPLTHS